MKSHLLSKSTFMYGCQCPLRLFYHKFMPELRNAYDEEQAAVYTAGTNIGILAQSVFPGGVNAEPPDSFSYHLSVAKTQELIQSGAKTIYEACFMYQDVLCAIDILVKKGNYWYAYEVKAVTKVKPPHIMDASLQYYVITNSGLALKDISIMHLDNSYVRRGEIEVAKLFKATSVLAEVLEKQSFIHNKAEELKGMILSKKLPTVEPGDQCFKPYDCDFTDHCWKDVVEEKIDYGKLKIDRKGIQEFLDRIQYPVFHFDFETVMHAVPEYNESRPYQQVPFQFSIHRQKTANAEVEHLEFLGDGLSDPRESLIKALLAALKNKGTILVWYKPFESTRLKELARDFPAYEKELNLLQDRIIDLMEPFKKKYYKHPGFEGSASIKKVSILIPDLSYKNLVIQEGGTAALPTPT